MDQTDDTEVNKTKRNGRQWPTAETLAELPADIQAVVGRYPELEDLFVVPPIHRMYRFATAIMAMVVVMIVLNSDAVARKSSQEMLMLGGGMLACLFLVVALGYIADRRRMPRRYLIIAVACGFTATAAVAAVLVPSGLAALQMFHDPNTIIEHITEVSLQREIITLLTMTFSLTTLGLLGFELARRISFGMSDSARWYWLRQSGLVESEDRMDLPDIHHRCVAPWFVLPRIRGLFAHWSLILPTIAIVVGTALVVSGTASTANAISDYRERQQIFAIALSLFPLSIGIFGLPGILLDMMRVRRTLGLSLLVGLPVGIGMLAAGMLWLGDATADDYMVVPVAACVTYLLTQTGMVLIYLGRSMRVHFRRQQLLTDMMEDALDVDEVDPPPYGPIDPDDAVLGYQPFPTPPPGEGSDT